ncbi:MAG TPA: zinc ribbon domain-containing protein [Bacteroidetes bacterium]|nr:zinc ribbon domain-containing protein [Bacteroidota bacterium]
MPIFEYRCKDCGGKFELFRSFSNTDPVCCPDCDSQNTIKLLSTFASSGGGSGDFSSSASSCCSENFG